MAYGNRLLYVSNTGEKTISVLNGTTGEASGEPIALAEQPAGIAVQDGTIFVGTTGDVTPIDEDRWSSATRSRSRAAATSWPTPAGSG